MINIILKSATLVLQLERNSRNTNISTESEFNHSAKFLHNEKFT